MSDAQLDEIKAHYFDEGLNISEIALIMGLPHSTVYHRIIQDSRYDKNENSKRNHKSQVVAISQYDENGTFIRDFNSISDASREIGVYRGQISQSLKNGYQCHGYYFVYKNQNLKIKNNKKKVYQFDMNGIYLNEYSGVREAGRILNIDYTGIVKCCNGK